MLTVSPVNNRQNINFMSSEKTIGYRMAAAYSKLEDSLREMLIERNSDLDPFSLVQFNRWATLVVSAIIGAVTGLIVCACHNYNDTVRHKVEVKETEVMQNRETELDKQYEAGTLLFEEYVDELNNVMSDYEALEIQTAQKLDDVVQSRIRNSNSKSVHSNNSAMGKYYYNLSTNNETKTAQINVLNSPATLNDTVPENVEKEVSEEKKEKENKTDADS